MRGRVVRALRSLDAVAVENPAYPGTPDVNYIGGWLELKWLRRWPENADTDPVLIRHFTQQQRVWLSRRCRRGGRAWLLLQVGQEYLLFDGEMAAEVVGRAPRGALLRSACKYWPRGLRSSELVECLTGRLISAS